MAHLHLALLCQQFVEAAQACSSADDDNPAGQVGVAHTGIFHLRHDVGDDFIRTGMHVVVDFGIIDTFTGAFTAHGFLVHGVAADFLDFLGTLLYIVEGGEIEGDVARPHREGGHIKRRPVLIDCHRCRFCPEVGKHAPEAPFVVG